MIYLAEKESDRLLLRHLCEKYFEPKDALTGARLEEENTTVTVTLCSEQGTFSHGARQDRGLHRTAQRARQAAIGRAFATAAQKLTDYRPPYGTLVGVRPVKLPLFYKEYGLSDQEILQILKEEYAVEETKARLLLSLAHTESEFARTLTEEDGMLYLSIPFCPTRCSYCSFISSSAPRHTEVIPSYVAQLKEEIRQTGRLFQKANKRLTAVYMGGGTPGILTPHEMDLLLEAVKENFPVTNQTEWTVELGRPDTVTAKVLDVLQKRGVGRISINPQTTCNETLIRVGRHHSAEDFFSAMALAKKYPFSINCDLIAALPEEAPETFLTSVKEVLACDPDHVTVHALCEKRSAKENGLPRRREGYVEAVEKAHEACMNSHYAPYYLYKQKSAVNDLENTGFAKEGEACRYNLAMMEDLTDIFSCGAGGIGKLLPRKGEVRIRRYAQFKYPYEWLAHPEKNCEILSDMAHALGVMEVL